MSFGSTTEKSLPLIYSHQNYVNGKDPYGMT